MVTDMGRLGPATDPAPLPRHSLMHWSTDWNTPLVVDHPQVKEVGAGGAVTTIGDGAERRPILRGRTATTSSAPGRTGGERWPYWRYLGACAR